MSNQANQRRPQRRNQPARSRDSQGRARRRGATLENALLQAAWEEVSALGYANLTPTLIERVSFSFNKISVVYTPQGPDGQPLGGTTFEDDWQTPQ